MIYFRMSEEFMDTDCINELSTTQYRHDKDANTRKFVYTQLALAGLYPSRKFKNAKAIADRFNVSIRQAEIVWEVCTRHGMLRPDGYGYTASAWLKENGFVE